MRVAIVGSREIEEMQLLREAIGDSKFDITHVISGGARGVDTLAEAWAKTNRIPITIFYADWEKYGKGAGHIRNAEVVRHSQAMIAIRYDVSRGTQNAIEQAKEQGISVFEKVVT